jgi:hypothetical protein
VTLSRHPLHLLAALLLGCLACATDDTIPVSTNYDPLVRFPAQASYVWDDAASTLPDDPAIDRADIDALFKSVADEAFAARGYRMTEGPAADFRLSYQYFVHTYIGPDVSRSIGSLSLLLADHASGRRVWMGFGRAEIHMGLSREERRARLAEAMRRMLEKFPPVQRPES